jgi:hypothetical protein
MVLIDSLNFIASFLCNYFRWDEVEIKLRYLNDTHLTNDPAFDSDVLRVKELKNRD